MRKKFGLKFELFFCSVLVGGALGCASSPPYRSLAASGPVSDAEVQTCLDQSRRDAWERRKRAKEQGEKNKAPPYTFHLVSARDLPVDCATGDLALLRQSIERQLASCKGFPATPAKPGMPSLRDRIRFGCVTFSREEWCSEANAQMLQFAQKAKDFPSFVVSLKEEFQWFQSDGMLEDNKDGRLKKGDFLFTAYDTPPAIEASAVPTRKFRYPIYRAPKNLVHFEDDDPRFCGEDPVTGAKGKYCLENADGTYSVLPDRRAIDHDKALAGQGLELAYVKDPVDMAFLMIQGSGSINLHKPDGSVAHLRVNYKTQNGRPRNLLGRVLICRGASPEEYANEAAIRKYLARDPANRDTILNFDQSYIFFELSKEGPFGADGIALTPRYSFATDRSVIPTGSLLLAHTRRPLGKSADCKNITTVGVSQDSGGAIIGAHADWYMGDGAEANALANDVNDTGTLFVAMPKGGGQAVEGCGGR